MWATPAERMQLYRASVIVTGPHYSITSLLGEILGQSRHFGMLYEPLNPQPTLDSSTLEPRFSYEFFAEADYPAFRDRLIGLMFAEALSGKVFAGRAGSAPSRTSADGFDLCV